VKWRALAVAVAGLSMALWACSFQKEWDAYCAHPGRCANLDAGADASIEIAQGSTNRKILLTGGYLADASVSLKPENTGTVSVDSVDDGGILLDVTLNPGVDAGERLTVRLHWERPEEDLSSIPLVVTPITADGTGDDVTGFGTPKAPYRTLLRASQQSNAGDIIMLGSGTFSSICTTTPGLKPGVAVEGLADGGSVVEGPGPCGFILSDPAQALRYVTISNFLTGVRATATTGRSTAFGITVQGCDAGVVVAPDGGLLLQQAHLNMNGTGLVSESGDVVVQGGTIEFSTRNGVLMMGDGGALSLTGSSVNNNASGVTDDQGGAGVLIASSAGTATIGSSIASNGHTAVTVSGTSNLVTLDGATLRSPFNGSVALVLRDPSAKAFMRNTTLQGSPVGLRVDGFATFNGGTGDGGFGRNTFECGLTDSSFLEIWDTRTSSGAEMDFENTSVHNVHMDAGVNISSSSGALGIQIDGPNTIHFH